jgi:hypothetical protein
MSTQVPGTSASLVTHWTSGPEFQLPRTVTPFTGLCRESCARDPNVRRQVRPRSSQSRPISDVHAGCGHRDDHRARVVARARIRQLLRGGEDVPTDARPAVFQLKVRTTLAPRPSPGIVCVPSTALPAVPSVSTTSKLAVTSLPTHVLHRDRNGGRVTPVHRPGRGNRRVCKVGRRRFTVTVAERELLAALSSLNDCVRHQRMTAQRGASAVFQLNERVAAALTASEGTDCVPIVTPAVASVSTTLKLPTFSPAHVLDGDADRGRTPLEDRDRCGHAGHGNSVDGATTVTVG